MAVRSEIQVFRVRLQPGTARDLGETSGIQPPFPRTGIESPAKGAAVNKSEPINAAGVVPGQGREAGQPRVIGPREHSAQADRQPDAATGGDVPGGPPTDFSEQTAGFPGGRETRWDAETRTLHARQVVPLDRSPMDVGIDTGKADITVSGIGDSTPFVQEVFAIQADSEGAAREILSRHHLSVTQVEDRLDVRTRHERAEHRVDSFSVNPDGSTTSFSSTSSFGEGGGIVITGGSATIIVGGSGEVTIDGKPLSEAGDTGVIYENVDHAVKLFVPGDAGDTQEAEYWLTTSGGTIHVENVHGAIDASSDHGHFVGRNFSGEANIEAPYGTVHMHDVTLEGDSKVVGGTIDLSVSNESLHVDAVTQDGGVRVPKDDFTTVAIAPGKGNLPRGVKGHFGADPDSSNRVALEAASDIAIRKT